MRGDLWLQIARVNERGAGVTIADAAQAVLDKVLAAQAMHVRDAHSRALTESCRTCMALSDAVEAARIAAVEATTLPEQPAQGRTRGRQT
jgi:hypothetical protein